MIKYFVVCTTPRSGSNFLYTLLDGNGLGPLPEAFASAHAHHPFSRALASGQSTEEYSATLKANAVNGYLGTKLFWGFGFTEAMLANSRKHVAMAGLFRELFPRAKYIFLRRRDKVGQAISLVKALDSGEWWRRRTTVGPVKEAKDITPRQVHDFVRLLMAEDMQWRIFFRGGGFRPLELYYEDLVEATEQTLNRVGRHIAGKGFHIKTLGSPLEVQRDQHSDRARDEYMKRLGTGRLDLF